jgi:hypothetical protein
LGADTPFSSTVTQFLTSNYFKSITKSGAPPGNTSFCFRVIRAKPTEGMHTGDTDLAASMLSTPLRPDYDPPLPTREGFVSISTTVLFVCLLESICQEPHGLMTGAENPKRVYPYNSWFYSQPQIFSSPSSDRARRINVMKRRTPSKGILQRCANALVRRDTHTADILNVWTYGPLWALWTSRPKLEIGQG